MEETHTGNPAGAPVARRRLLGAGLGGAAFSLLPFLSARAFASSGGGTTTTAPPKRPTEEDTAMLNDAQAFELSIRDLYDEAINTVTSWSDAEVTVMTTFRQAHRDFANGINAALGRHADNQRNERLFEQLKGDFSKDRESALQAAWSVESAAVATYSEMLGKLQGINLAGRVASVQVAEAQHCTVLADLLGSEDKAILLVDEEAQPIEVNG